MRPTAIGSRAPPGPRPAGRCDVRLLMVPALIVAVAVALRRSGAQLVANGRIPVQALIAALDAAEAAD